MPTRLSQVRSSPSATSSPSTHSRTRPGETTTSVLSLPSPFEPSSSLTFPPRQNARTLRAGIYGFFFWSPILNRWHALLNRITFRSRPVEILARVAVDQVCLAPFGAVYYFAVMGLLERRPFDDIKSRISANFARTAKTAICIFAPAQTISQVALPLPARPPFMNCASLAFGVYIAGVNSSKRRPEPLAASADPTP